MEEYTVKIKNSAKTDLKKVKQSQLKDNFMDIVDTLKRNPYEETHSFEKLYPLHRGLHSRRLNIKHRVVYTSDEENKEVIIYSAWGHYQDN